MPESKLKKLTKKDYDNSKKEISAYEKKIEMCEEVIEKYKKQLIEKEYLPCKGGKHKDVFRFLSPTDQDYVIEVCRRCFDSRSFELWDNRFHTNNHVHDTLYGHYWDSDGECRCFNKTKEDENNYKRYQAFVKKIENENF
jgi:hypothetical protein